MSTEMDFKALWNKQGTGDVPDTKELFVKVDGLKKQTRTKLIRLNLMLLATTAFILYIGFNIDNEQLTTKIGVVLVVAAMVSYLIAYNQLIPMLFKSDMETSSQEYLNQLIKIKRKNEFLNKVMINIYFGLLSAGMALYMVQFALRMAHAWAIFWYVITFSWIAFSWFYLRPRGMKKKLKPLNDMIEKLEAVNGQLKSPL